MEESSKARDDLYDAMARLCQSISSLIVPGPMEIDQDRKDKCRSAGMSEEQVAQCHSHGLSRWNVAS